MFVILSSAITVDGSVWISLSLLSLSLYRAAFFSANKLVSKFSKPFKDDQAAFWPVQVMTTDVFSVRTVYPTITEFVWVPVKRFARTQADL